MGSQSRQHWHNFYYQDLRVTEVDKRIQRIERILEEQGGLYSFEDFLAELDRGSIQSFSMGESTVFTSIRDFPRKRVLEVRLAVGNLPEIYALQPQIVAFAKQNKCELMLASVGRDGWNDVVTPGWDRVASTFIRRL